jgi:transposase
MKRDDVYYIGLDIHKRIVAYCVKTIDGSIVSQGSVDARRSDLAEWADRIGHPWIGAMEATMFTGWVHDLLEPRATELKVGNPQKIKAICSGKKKSDRIDAATLADLLRVDLLPECYMAPRWMRDLRRTLRYRNFLVRHNTALKNRAAGVLMELGVEYDGDRLHGKRYFAELLGSLEEEARSAIPILQFNHEAMRTFDRTQRRLTAGLERHERLAERVARLRTIPGVGPILALTWALEIGDPHRFSAIRKAVSYCGLSSRFISSAGVVKRAPLSKQRNEHLQWVLIEVAKLAPTHNPTLAEVRQRTLEKGANKNQATLAVARKLVAYLMAVDKSGKPFEAAERPAA